MKPTSCLLDQLLTSAYPLIFPGLLLGPIYARAESPSMLVDDFADTTYTMNGMPRMVFTDKEAGGQSQATHSFADEIISVQGKLVPGRGTPAFVSIPLVLTPTGNAQDLSDYEGVRIQVKVKQGSLMVQLSSADIVNFDFHTSKPITRNPDEFKEVRIPFTALKRAWSEQTPLNLKTITSVKIPV
ncbi:MAG: CIA30 family protein [Candidatus Synoicihabitans palmerolidicus]|nr:CIA30 family protein [Candidatus Synoicihabitans palmerolidicus]